MENGLVNVASRLASQGFGFYVCCLEQGGEFAARLPEPANVRILDKPPGLSWRTAARLAHVVRSVRPDLIHTHNYGPLIYTVFSRLFGGGNVPILHGEHGMLFPYEIRRSHVWLRRWLYARCARVHTVSRSLCDHFSEHGFPGHRMEAVINGVDSDRFQPASDETVRRRFNIPDDARVVGILGSFAWRKRHELVLQAFEILAREMPDLHLLVVGAGGTEQARVEQLCRAHPASSRIHLAGFQSDPRPFYRAMNLLVVPSVNEGLSNATLEAMACGIPALCHVACGNAEVITSGQDGMVADLGDAEKLCARLKAALENPARLARMGTAARQTVVSRFSIHSMVEHYARLYRTVAGRETVR
ncbi:MAG: glycosyltransferase family 4 protein [Verrucomicrobiota bacterium]